VFQPWAVVADIAGRRGAHMPWRRRLCDAVVVGRSEVLRKDRATPEESRGGPINHSDADWGDRVLAALLDKLRSAPARGRRGNLSLVKSMTTSSPSA
jgi:hypothetical protein